MLEDGPAPNPMLQRLKRSLWLSPCRLILKSVNSLVSLFPPPVKWGGPVIHSEGGSSGFNIHSQYPELLGLLP